MNITDFAILKKLCGGGGDWNASEGEAGYVQNRTHWADGWSIEWDGNPDGKEIGYLPDGTPFVKVSDKVLTKADLVGATITDNDNSVQYTEETVEAVVREVATGFIWGTEPQFISVAKTSFDVNGNTLEFPSTGTYFGYVFKMSKETVKKIDMKYLPIDELKTALGIS